MEVDVNLESHIASVRYYVHDEMGSLSPHAAHFQRPSFQLLPTPGSKADLLHDIRSLPDLVHFNAVHNPDHVFCLQSKQPHDATQCDFTRITFRQLAQAVEHCCVWILANINGARPPVVGHDRIIDKAPPIALFLESDVGLFIYLTALLSLNIPVSFYIHSWPAVCSTYNSVYFSLLDSIRLQCSIY